MNSEQKTVSIKLPQCCIDVSDDCPHVVRKPKEKKTNIGL